MFSIQDSLGPGSQVATPKKPAATFPTLVKACENSSKRRKLGLDSFDSPAQISVGKSEEKFFFHKALLCGLAPFFQAALNGLFREAIDAMIVMPEETSATMRRFQLWAYTGSPLDADEDLENVTFESLIQLYFFAEKYDLSDMQNAATDILVAKTNSKKCIPSRLFVVYPNTISSSPLRRLLIAWTTHTIDLDAWLLQVKELDIIPHEFMCDLALELHALRKNKGKKYDWAKLGCEFHIHPELAPQCKQQDYTTNASKAV